MKKGILLTNLGTPEKPTKMALKKYLKEFLSDDRVIQPFNKILWSLVLNFIILNTRPEKSAIKYLKIWNKFGDGSPLLDITNLQLNAVKKTLSAKYDNLEFVVGMNYGKPSMLSAFNELKNKNCKKFIIFPLYPQYSRATVLSTFDNLNSFLNNNKKDTVFISSYHKDKKYIESLSNSVIEHQKKHSKPDKLIMSFHGIPQRFVNKGDIYYQQCINTSKLLAEKLNLKNDEYQVSFHSKFGPEKWIKPDTDDILQSLAKENISHIQVICPGFSADCLETLLDIEIESKDIFINAGGKKFSYIRSLNDRKDHIEMMCSIIEKYL